MKFTADRFLVLDHSLSVFPWQCRSSTSSKSVRNLSRPELMIEVQLPLPHSMPHAVASGSTVDSFPPRFPKLEQVLPPLSAGSFSSVSGNTFGSQQQTTFSYSRPLTPSCGMSAPHGGLGVTQYNGYGSQRGGAMLSGQRRQEHAGNNVAFSSNNAVDYQAPSHYGGQSYGAPPSPKSQRPPMPSTESASRRKTTAGAVAPALQIPSTINTPQGSMPQLAAEVCLLCPSTRSSLTLPDNVPLLVRELIDSAASTRPQVTLSVREAPRG